MAQPCIAGDRFDGKAEFNAQFKRAGDKPRAEIVAGAIGLTFQLGRSVAHELRASSASSHSCRAGRLHSRG